MADNDMNSVPGPTDDKIPPRVFEAQGRSWIARFAGEGAGGTGIWALGRLHTVHFCSEQDPENPLNLAPQREVPVAMTYAMTNSFGFGGPNASLIFARP